ncbi:MAG: hypothetical protein PVI03_00880 [Candidatus Thorarchaeota archaeon]|jgi:hypothetical protein
MAKELNIQAMIGALVVIVVGVVLIPTITGTITDANITDTATASIVGLIPFMFGVALLYTTVRGLL